MYKENLDKKIANLVHLLFYNNLIKGGLIMKIVFIIIIEVIKALLSILTMLL